MLNRARGFITQGSLSVIRDGKRWQGEAIDDHSIWQIVEERGHCEYDLSKHPKWNQQSYTGWTQGVEVEISRVEEIDPRDCTKERYVMYDGRKRSIPAGVEAIDWLRLSREDWQQCGSEIVSKGVGGRESDDDHDFEYNDKDEVSRDLLDPRTEPRND
jgi:hypothetical protein